MKQVSGPFCTFLSQFKRVNKEFAPLRKFLFQDMMGQINH